MQVYTGVMGMHWTRAQYLAGAAFCLPSMLSLIPIAWLDAYPYIRVGGIAFFGLLAALMVYGAFTTKPPKPESIEYITAQEALEYIATDSLWGVMNTHDGILGGESQTNFTSYIRLSALEEFARKAPGNYIRAIGIIKGHASYTSIDPTYWYNARISWDIFNAGNICKTEGIGPIAFANLPIYTEIKICKEDLSSTWPTPPWWWWP